MTELEKELYLKGLKPEIPSHAVILALAAPEFCPKSKQEE